jgi:hypothetical protein
MPLRRRETNCGPPNIWLHQTTEREKLISNVLKQNNWPVNKSDLVIEHIKHLIQFVNSIYFGKLWTLTIKINENITLILTQVHIWIHKTVKRVHMERALQTSSWNTEIEY